MTELNDAFLPVDAQRARLMGRVWQVHAEAALCGPCPVAVHGGMLYDLSPHAPTCAQLLALEERLEIIDEAVRGPPMGAVDAVWRNSVPTPDPRRPRFLSPLDLQCIKAAGVTFADSLIERVIEERAGGDPAAAAGARELLRQAIGVDWAKLRPGSQAAAQAARHLKAQGLWSQYLEVGLGADAEIFTKAPVLSSVGPGQYVGVHPASAWSNPEPEVVLVVDRRGEIVGATLGNDVNLRDFEGRSALLLGRGKDNNASCAIGPVIRLLDQRFTLADVGQLEVAVRVEGADGHLLRGRSAMTEISRDLRDLVAQTIGPTHQYPDGLALMTGTHFAPTADRGEPGMGYTHREGDVVTVSSPKLGTLRNTVTTSDRAPPWEFGVTALMRNLHRRGLLRDEQ